MVLVTWLRTSRIADGCTKAVQALIFRTGQRSVKPGCVFFGDMGSTQRLKDATCTAEERQLDRMPLKEVTRNACAMRTLSDRA